MNTTIDLTDDQNGTVVEPATENATHRRPGRGGTLKARCRRLAAVAAVAVPAVVGTIAVLPSSPAAAYQKNTQYVIFDSNVICDSYKDTMSINVWARPAIGYSSVSVQFRLRVTDVLSGDAHTGWWQPWRQLNTYGNTILLDNTVPAGNGFYLVYVELRYWTGTAWSAPMGTTATHWHLGGTTRPIFDGVWCAT